MYKHIGNSGRTNRNSLCGNKLYTTSVKKIETNSENRSGKTTRFRNVSLAANRKGTVAIPSTVGKPIVKYQCLQFKTTQCFVKHNLAQFFLPRMGSVKTANLVEDVHPKELNRREDQTAMSIRVKRNKCSSKEDTICNQHHLTSSNSPIELYEVLTR